MAQEEKISCSLLYLNKKVFLLGQIGEKTQNIVDVMLLGFMAVNSPDFCLPDIGGVYDFVDLTFWNTRRHIDEITGNEISFNVPHAKIHNFF